MSASLSRDETHVKKIVPFKNAENHVCLQKHNEGKLGIPETISRSEAKVAHNFKM